VFAASGISGSVVAVKATRSAALTGGASIGGKDSISRGNAGGMGASMRPRLGSTVSPAA
jgi:hypothetical protein